MPEAPPPLTYGIWDASSSCHVAVRLPGPGLGREIIIIRPARGMSTITSVPTMSEIEHEEQNHVFLTHVIPLLTFPFEVRELINQQQQQLEHCSTSCMASIFAELFTSDRQQEFSPVAFEEETR